MLFLEGCRVSHHDSQQTQPLCLFQSHGNPQVSYQYRALFKLSKIWSQITCGEKFNKYSKNCIFQHCFLLISFADICGLINHLLGMP